MNNTIVNRTISGLQISNQEMAVLIDLCDGRNGKIHAHHINDGWYTGTDSMGYGIPSPPVYEYSVASTGRRIDLPVFRSLLAKRLIGSKIVEPHVEYHITEKGRQLVQTFALPLLEGLDSKRFLNVNNH